MNRTRIEHMTCYFIGRVPDLLNQLRNKRVHEQLLDFVLPNEGQTVPAVKVAVVHILSHFVKRGDFIQDFEGCFDDQFPLSLASLVEAVVLILDHFEDFDEDAGDFDRVCVDHEYVGFGEVADSIVKLFEKTLGVD